jgi:hypothetical protein
VAKPELRATLVSPLGYLRDLGFRIERVADEFEWWSLTVPTDAWRKSKNRCTLATIVQIANAEGWQHKAMMPDTRPPAVTPTILPARRRAGP